MSNTFFLVPPEIISLPSKWNAIEGRNISAMCEASGKPAPEIIWLRRWFTFEEHASILC